MAAMFCREGGEIPDFVVDLIQKSDPETRPNIINSAMEGEFKDETEIVSQIKIPIAIFHGQNDQLVNFEYFSELKIPNLWQNMVQVIPNAGHLAQWENDKVFNNLLVEFTEFI